MILRPRTILKMGVYFSLEEPIFGFRGIFFSSKLIVVVVALSIFKGVILASSVSVGRLAAIMLHPDRIFWPHRAWEMEKEAVCTTGNSQQQKMMQILRSRAG